MKPGKNTPTPRRSMVLRSSCQGDCTSGTGKSGTHHHHHHPTKQNTPVSASNAKQLSASLKSSSRSSSQKRTVIKKETASKEVDSYTVHKSITSKEYSPANIKSVVEKVLDYSLATLSPIVVASQELANSWGKENGFKPAQNLAKNFSSRTATTTSSSLTTSKISSSITNLRRSQLTSNHSRNLEPFSASPIANAEDWAKQNGITPELTHQSTKTRYSDYSSADESDDLRKTDYTYAQSASYCLETNQNMDIRTPNMSRPSIHSSGSSGSYSSSLYQAASVPSEVYHVHLSTPKSYQSRTLNSVSLWNTINSTKNVERQETASYTYGLDSDSDDEVGVRNVRTSSSGFSLFSVLLNVGECILPVQTVWQKFWGFVYWMLTSLLLWDTWILTRQYFRKRLLLPLLLLLILPLCLWRTHEDANELYPSVLTHLSSFGMFLIPSLFAENSKTEKDTIVHIDHLQVKNEKIDEMIMKMHTIQQTQLSRPDIEEIVRSVVKEEILHLAKQMNGQEESILQQAKSLSDLDSQLTSLESQMKLMLAEELKNAKEKILSEYRSDQQISLLRLGSLEKEMESLKDNIQHVKETQTILLETNRNCCRNHTYDPVLVENQVAAVLLQIMSNSPKPGKSRPEFQSFAAWLKSSFVDYDGLALTTRKINDDLEALSSRTEMVAKSVAAAAVGAALLQQRESRNQSAYGGTHLTETDVRQIVRNALVLYDADKTGMADFALESAGGSIISTRCSETFYSRTALLTLFGIPLWFYSNSPRTVIQPGVHPGECWAFKGSEGYLVIQLSNSIRPTAFSLEHIPRLLAPNNNIDSAPREFSVFGLTGDKELEGVLIGRYVYDIDGEPLQHFLVKDPDIEAFPVVELHIHNNHGNIDYTCLYRFRVHGKSSHR